jgi:choline dehydrogenase-like flavoprotein
MIDAGLKLEAERSQAVENLRARAPETWDPEALAFLKEGMESTAKGIVLKRVFGSDFPYREADRHIPADYEGTALRPSLALGGLSNVWGAAMLPFCEDDLKDWPIHSADLCDHYAAVLQFVPLSARQDDLAEKFPLYTEQFGELDLSRQSQLLWRNLWNARDELRAHGIDFGASRLAVKARRSNSEDGCNYTGLCMYGCPLGYIYISTETVREMQRRPGFSYERDIVVTGLRETAAQVTLEGYRRISGERWSETVERVYLAAGVIPTTQILLASRGEFERPLYIKDSQYFLFPLLFARRTPGVRDEALHTLSQLFVEVGDPGADGRRVHMQLYSFNDLITPALRKALGPLAFDVLVRQLEDRLMIAQSYLHSDFSSRVRLTLRAGSKPRLQLRAEINPQTRPAIRALLRKLLRHAPRIGAAPVWPMLQITPPGRGFHSGGTFPMRAAPGPFESDVLGRPYGWERVHAVDSTVFPSIPSTTITFSIMANAHRIGTFGGRLR